MRPNSDPVKTATVLAVLRRAGLPMAKAGSSGATVRNGLYASLAPTGHKIGVGWSGDARYPGYMVAAAAVVAELNRAEYLPQAEAVLREAGYSVTVYAPNGTPSYVYVDALQAPQVPVSN